MVSDTERDPPVGGANSQGTNTSESFLELIDDPSSPANSLESVDRLPVLQSMSGQYGEQDTTAIARYRCPYCGASTRFLMLFLVYPEEGLWCPDCENGVVIGAPPKKFLQTLSASGPLDREAARQRTRYRPIGPAGISPRFRGPDALDEIEVQIAKQARLLSVLDSVTGADGSRRGITSPAGSIARLQHPIPLLVGVSVLAVIATASISAVSFASGLAVAAVLVAITAGVLVTDYRRIETTIKEHSFDNSIDPVDFLRFPVNRNSPLPLRALRSIVSTVRSVVGPNRKA